MGPAFLPYCGPVYARCINITHQSLTEFQNWQQDPENIEEPDKAFLVVALDMLSGLVQGLGMGLQPHIESAQPHVLDLLVYCLKVRQLHVMETTRD